MMLTMTDPDTMAWKSSGKLMLPNAFAVMLTHSSLSSLAAATNLCSNDLIAASF